MNEFQTENKEFIKDKTNENLINQQMDEYIKISIFDKITFFMFFMYFQIKFIFKFIELINSTI